MNLLIVLRAVSLHPWPGLTFICIECGVYLRRWNEMCLSCDWCVNIGCVLFHILPWYHILRGMTRVLYCIFIFVLFTLTMSRVRKLTDKGRELLVRNMRGKCASSFRFGNAIINKLVPLLKDNTSSIEQVTEYISNLEHHKSSIVQSYSEFNEKFAGDLDTLADFHKWFNPRYDALQSVLQYSRDWVQNVHFQEGVDKDISALSVPDFQDDHDDIQPEDSASQVTPQPESGCSSNKTSRSRGSSVRSARVQESLKKVALTAQVNSLKQKQELMRKELELTMQKESLELTTNLAIATAKEEVLLDVELAKEFSVLSHDKTHQVSLHVSQSERPADTSPSVHVDHMHLSVPSNLTSTSVRPAVTVNTVRSQIDGGGPAIVVGQDVNVTSSDLSVRQSVLGQLSDAQSVSHTDPKTVTRSVPDIVSDRVSVAMSHFTDGMPTRSRRSDAGEFSGGSQQHSEDLGFVWWLGRNKTFPCTLDSRYVAAIYNMILRTEQKIQWYNFDQTLHSRTTPHVSHSRASYGVPFRAIFKEIWPRYIESAMFVHSTIRTLLCVAMSQYINVSVNVSLKFQEIIEPHTPIFAL